MLQQRQWGRKCLPTRVLFASVRTGGPPASSTSYSRFLVLNSSGKIRHTRRLMNPKVDRRAKQSQIREFHVPRIPKLRIRHQRRRRVTSTFDDLNTTPPQNAEVLKRASPCNGPNSMGNLRGGSASRGNEQEPDAVAGSYVGDFVLKNCKLI